MSITSTRIDVDDSAFVHEFRTQLAPRQREIVHVWIDPRRPGSVNREGAQGREAPRVYPEVLDAVSRMAALGRFDGRVAAPTPVLYVDASTPVQVVDRVLDSLLLRLGILRVILVMRSGSRETGLPTMVGRWAEPRNRETTDDCATLVVSSGPTGTAIAVELGRQSHSYPVLRDDGHCPAIANRGSHPDVEALVAFTRRVAAQVPLCEDALSMHDDDTSWGEQILLLEGLREAERSVTYVGRAPQRGDPCANALSVIDLPHMFHPRSADEPTGSGEHPAPLRLHFSF